LTDKELRDLLRRDLGTALKARDAEAVAALRTTIAAIDNAEAVDTTTIGVGSTEVPRRDLSMDDARAILHNHIDDYVTEADATSHWDNNTRRSDYADKPTRYASIARDCLQPVTVQDTLTRHHDRGTLSVAQTAGLRRCLRGSP
jgi:uncharacterized protein